MAEPRSEPSMEDILASIKRIIADEPAAVPKPGTPVTAPHIPSVVPQRMAEPEPAPAPRREPPPPPWPTRAETPPPEPIRRATSEPAMPAEPQPVQRAVERLRQAESELPPATPRPVPRDLLPRTPTPRPSGGDITLDALVREMIQPMLSDWIEQNLPDMVERMVQAEIRRMIDKEA